MGTRRNWKPVPQIGIRVSEEFYRFLEDYKGCRLHEPKYVTCDRLMHDIDNNRNKDLYNIQVQELKDSNSLLRIENRDLKDSIINARRKIRDYEFRLGIISQEEVRLQERNEQQLSLISNPFTTRS